eukprot:scaffold721_cov327-Prasinococcus_capsulatus_cf.AAC.3
MNGDLIIIWATSAHKYEPAHADMKHICLRQTCSCVLKRREAASKLPLPTPCASFKALPMCNLKIRLSGVFLTSDGRSECKL